MVLGWSQTNYYRTVLQVAIQNETLEELSDQRCSDARVMAQLNQRLAKYQAIDLQLDGIDRDAASSRVSQVSAIITEASQVLNNLVQIASAPEPARYQQQQQHEICCICMDKAVCIAALPCGHCFCDSCPNMIGVACPLCRGDIVGWGML